MKLIHDIGYLIALAILLAAALFACAGPPPVPTATRPPAVPRKVETPPQAPPAAPGRYTWTSNDAVPGQINLRLNGRQIGAYRLADGVYLELRGGVYAPEASQPPVAVPAAYRAKGAPATVPFVGSTPGTTAQADAAVTSLPRPVAAPLPARTGTFAPSAVRSFGITISNCRT